MIIYYIVQILQAPFSIALFEIEIKIIVLISNDNKIRSIFMKVTKVTRILIPP